MAALRSEEIAQGHLHVIARVWPEVKAKTGLTQQKVFDRYRELCRQFGIKPKDQVGALGQWFRGKHRPDVEEGLIILQVFAEALSLANETVDDPLFPGGRGSPGNRTLNLRIADPLY